MLCMVLINSMNVHGLDLNLLRVFDTVLRDRSVTAAARRLGLTQPAVSNALARLRAQFEDALFVRTSTGMDATPFARELVKHAPERLVWGSDWPHVNMNGRGMPNDGDLVDLLGEWVPDASVRKRILVDNPATLFGF